MKSGTDDETSGAPPVAIMGDVAPISGTQHRIGGGGYEAIIASVGASLRVLRDPLGDLIAPFAADEMRPAMSGALLAPWPNRTAGGRYEFDGREHQLGLSEPELRNASHGLVAWQNFTVVSKDDSRVVLSTTIEAQPGYPWRVRLEVSFELDARGLAQRVVATNEGHEAAPFGMGGHPYLLAGRPASSGIDDWYLELPADEVIQVSPDRLLPIGIEGVDANKGLLDFRHRRAIGNSVLNHAFGALSRDEDGIARARLTDSQGFGVEIACGPSCRWLQVYTADAGVDRYRRHALAVEPMSCPPDALNSRIDLVRLEPGRAFSMEWRISRLKGSGG